MNTRISKIENHVQNRDSKAWKKLCEYIDKIAAEGSEEFAPLEYLGDELYSQIYTLPESIRKLKKVKKMWLYGSNLKRIPPEIGEMEALEYFDPYTSYSLKWFPYELMHCKNLVDSRVSTRAIYGNFKNRMGFPRLDHNPVRYHGNTVHCGVCKNEMTYEVTNQMWISLWVGTDVLPLLVNLCSKQCEDQLPQPPKAFVQQPHKGGLDIIQPTYEEWEEAYTTKITMEEMEEMIKKNKTENNTKPTLLKRIRKIWDK